MPDHPGTGVAQLLFSLGTGVKQLLSTTQHRDANSFLLSCLCQGTPRRPRDIPGAGLCRFRTQRCLQGDTGPLLCCSDMSLAPLRPQKVLQLGDLGPPSGRCCPRPPACARASCPGATGALWPSQCPALQGDRGGGGNAGARVAHRPWDPTGDTGFDMTGGGEGALALGRFPCPMEAPCPDPVRPSQAPLSTPSILLHPGAPGNILCWPGASMSPSWGCLSDEGHTS